MNRHHPSLVTLIFVVFSPIQSVDADTKRHLTIQQADRICIIGNTLADRMQHDGWLETFIQSRYPRHQLVFRNLGFSADELTLQLRSKDFGSSDHWLAQARADVIFAFFGYNESFVGEDGLKAFRRDLNRQIKHLLAQKYNGTSSPRLVLFTPIAHENLHDPNLPDGRDNNKRLSMYAAAMREAAEENEIPLVDLFQLTLKQYAQSSQTFTINGIHLNEAGNRAVAELVDRSLFLEPSPPRNIQWIERLRQAILDKNFYWFHRYRTTDGYAIYGGRADLKFVEGQTNRIVTQREMKILDVMTANRDQNVWAVAQGNPWVVNDDNTPDFVPVVTNKKGSGPEGSHLFYSGESAIDVMTVADGFQVELVADEEMFPELINPVQMAFDTDNRLWVAAWESYPHWKPQEDMNDKLLILEDQNGDGKADVCKTFADNLHNPTGFEFWGDGVFVAMAPDLLFLKDTNGDDVADVRIRMLSGLDSADTHHTANSFVLGPGGALYFQEGTFHQSQVESPWGPPRRCANGGVFRFEPRSQKFDVYVSYGFANPHGHSFDRWGVDIVHDGTGAIPYHGTVFSGRIDFPAKHPRAPTVYERRTRPCPASEFLSSKHFPDEFQQHLLVANVIGFQGILLYKIADQGSSITGTEVDPLLFSSDPNFRPVDMEIGPDGALYFVDWQNPIIGHMQHNLRDPSRDRKHGRVYRVTYPDRPLRTLPQISGQPVEKLLELLQDPDDRVRYRTRIELSKRKTDRVISAVKTWITKIKPQDPEREHHRLEALWVHQQHNVVDVNLLQCLLTSPNHRARVAATRVLCYWRDRVPTILSLLRELAADPHPRVRLEAVRTASFLDIPEAIEVPRIAAELPTDKYFDYVYGETMKVLEPIWKDALSEGVELALRSEAGRRFFFDSVSVEQLLKMKRNETVLYTILRREGIQDEYRLAALAGLSELQDKIEIEVLLSVVQDFDRRQQPESVVIDLMRLLTQRETKELLNVGDQLENMAATAKMPIVRQLAYVAIIATNESVDRAWDLAIHSADNLVDLINAMPLITDPSVQASLFPKVEPLLRDVPRQFTSGENSDPTVARIRRAAMNAMTYVRGQETNTFMKLADFVHTGTERAAALQAMHRIPRRDWPVEQVQPLLDSILAYVGKLPDKERTSPESLDALQLGDALASLLPPEQSKEARAALGELGVRVVRIGTRPHRMAFDKEQIVIQAGEPIEFILENSDIMPHNFVITQPGAMEEIGVMAENTAQQPDAAARHYVPQSNKILLSSELLQPRQSKKLSFIAPARPGVYPYVCTYPGHWRRMYGALYVVEDMDDYIGNPEAYLSAHPLPIVDELLKFSRPRTEWKFEELASSVVTMRHGRSFGNAKQIFKVANCVACHQLNGDGQSLGPDLAKLDPKFQVIDILQEVLEPSKNINEKFQTYIFELTSGKTVQGLVIKENDNMVHVIENPLSKIQAVGIEKSDIEIRRKSPNSIMPKGLLNKLTREEVLDLIAYVTARGNKRHPLFQNGHHH